MSIVKQSNLLKAFISVCAGIVLLCCDKDVQPVEEQELTYTLMSDKTEVEVNEMITFTVMSSAGEDVTSEWSICDESLCFTSNRVSYGTAGTHTISAHYTADDTISAGNTLTITVKDSEDDKSGGEEFFPLNPDAVYELCADIETAYTYYDEVTFHVREVVDGEVQNDNVKNFLIGVVGSDMGDRFETGVEYTFTEPGTYEFDAVLYYRSNGDARQIKSENTVTIEVREKRKSGGYTENYYHRSLFLKWTATWCGGCPEMDTNLEKVMHSYVLTDRIVPVAMHEPGNDYCYPGPEAGRVYLNSGNAFGIQLIPSCAIDFDKRYVGVGSTEHEIYKFVKKSLTRRDDSKTPGIKITTSLNGRTLSYKVESAIRDTGDYLLGIFFIEDGLLTYQYGAENNKMVQNHVLHHSLTNGDNSLGLYEYGSLADGDNFEYSGTFEIPVHEEPADFVFENCQIVYFICEKDPSIEPFGYFCANAGAVGLGESSEYEYEPAFIE